MKRINGDQNIICNIMGLHVIRVLIRLSDVCFFFFFVLFGDFLVGVCIYVAFFIKKAA